MAGLLERLIHAVLPTPTRGVGASLPAITSLATQGTPLGGLRGKIEGIIPKDISAPKLSANEIIRRVRAMGFPVQRDNALKTIKAIRQQVDAYTYVQNLTPGRKPLMSKIPAAEYRQRLKYQYTVALTGSNVKTGEPTVQYIRINSPRLISKNEAIGMATDYAVTKNAYEIGDITDSDVPIITIQNPNLVNE